MRFLTQRLPAHANVKPPLSALLTAAGVCARQRPVFLLLIGGSAGAAGTHHSCFLDRGDEDWKYSCANLQQLAPVSLQLAARLFIPSCASTHERGRSAALLAGRHAPQGGRS